MKSNLSLVFIAICITKSVMAQPVIADASNLPPVGFTATMFSGIATVPPGAGGAGVTWDFSSVSMANVGTYAIVNPATSPVAATYPGGNYALSVTPTAGSPLYSYYITSGSDMKELANSVTTAAGSGVDYTSGPRKILKFPYAYTDNFTGTYSSAVTTGTDHSEYDGYGTLITPWATYTNVVRIKNRYTSSIGYAINWYTLNPLLSIFSFDSTSNRYTGLSVTPSNVNSLYGNGDAVSIWPNPIENNAIIRIAGNIHLLNAVIEITDVTGKVARRVQLQGYSAMLDRGDLKPGIYFYHLKNDGVCIKKGKLVIQ